ncbi:MAG: HNH endonuclease signature motif containing protein [Nocardioides sp.]
MSTTALRETPAGEPAGALSRAEILAFTRQARADVAAANVRVLMGAAEWVVLHATCPGGEAEASHPETDGAVSLTGEGAPGLRETALVEFGAAVGVSTASARLLLAHAAELVYRLPRVWRRVQAGEVEVWRARRIADTTVTLSLECAGFVDEQLAPVAHVCGSTRIDGAVEIARARFDSASVADADLDEAAHRGVRVDPLVRPGGTVGLDLCLDLADALDFDRAVGQMAELLALQGNTEDLDARRALAVGEIARRQLGTDLFGRGPDGKPVRAAARPPIQLYLHLRPHDLHREGRGLTLEIGNAVGGTITEEALERWYFNPDSRVTVKPVIDLNDETSRDETSSAGTVVPARLVERIYLRDKTCVFPWCGRPARPPTDRQGTDCDHIVPSGEGGPTSMGNLAALCRRHHRHKTFFGWSYTPLRPGRYLWTAPDGARYLRDGATTRALDPDPPPTAHRLDEHSSPWRWATLPALTRVPTRGPRAAPDPPPF